MPKKVVASFAIPVVLILALLVFRGNSIKKDGFSIGVVPEIVVATLDHNYEVCERPIGLPVSSRKISVVASPSMSLDLSDQPNRSHKPGPLQVQVRRADRLNVLVASGVIRSKNIKGGPVRTTLDRTIKAQSDVAICVRNMGSQPVDLWGGYDVDGPTIRGVDRVFAHPTLSTAKAYLDGKSLGADITVTFTGERDHTLLSGLPRIFARADRFKAAGVGAWTYWVLLALVVFVAPLVLARALIIALRTDRGPS